MASIVIILNVRLHMKMKKCIEPLLTLVLQLVKLVATLLNKASLNIFIMSL